MKSLWLYVVHINQFHNPKMISHYSIFPTVKSWWNHSLDNSSHIWANPLNIIWVISTSHNYSVILKSQSLLVYNTLILVCNILIPVCEMKAEFNTQQIHWTGWGKWKPILWLYLSKKVQPSWMNFWLAE